MDVFSAQQFLSISILFSFYWRNVSEKLPNPRGISIPHSTYSWKINWTSVINLVKRQRGSAVPRSLEESQPQPFSHTLLVNGVSQRPEAARTPSHTGGGLSLRRVAGSCGSGLSGKCVHGTKELIRDASGLAQPAEEGAVDSGGVVPDGVLSGKEQTRDGLKEGGREREREEMFR